MSDPQGGPAAGRWPAPLGLFAVWMFATWLLEGRQNGLHDAGNSLLPYTLVANFAVGIVGSLWLVRQFVVERGLDPARVGFVGRRRMTLALPAAVGMGAAMLLLLRPTRPDPIAMVNVFALTLAVSVAEVLVCWVAVAAGLVALAKHGRPRVLVPAGLAISALLFAVYHFAHSPPYNTPSAVAGLTLVGLVTGVFFYAAREVYATILFHNCLATLGIAFNLTRDRALGGLERLSLPALATALAALAVLVAGDRLLIRRPRGSRPGKPSGPGRVGPRAPARGF